MTWPIIKIDLKYFKEKDMLTVSNVTLYKCSLNFEQFLLYRDDMQHSLDMASSSS